jgi:hypothetical protein
MIVLLLLFAQPMLTQQTRSFAFDLPAGVADATPVFGPIREREWSPEWAPRFIHPAVPSQREGAVFTTATHGRTRLWVLTEYDPRVGRVAYLVTDPDFLVTEIKISVVPAGERTSRATVTYRRSALTERANEQVDALTANWAAEQAHHWGAAIAAALKRSGGRE